MPNKAPKYQSKGYAYWANYFALPSDLVVDYVNRADGVSPGAKPGRNDPANLNKDIQTLSKRANVIAQVKSPDTRKGLQREDLDPDVQKLYDQVIATEQKAGVTPEPGFLDRAIDILSRPIFAVANAYKATVEEEQRAGGGTDINDLAYLPLVGPAFWKSLSQGQELWDGFAGYDKTYFSDVLKTAHPDMNDVAAGVLGFALDVTMDPTTYLGGTGLVKAGGKVGLQGAKIGKEALEDSDEIAKFFRESPDAWQDVRKYMEDEFEKSGIVMDTPQALKTLDQIDFANPNSVAKFLTSGVEDAGVAKKVALGDLTSKTRTRQVITTFLDATSKAVEKNIQLRLFDEKVVAAQADGLLVDTTKLHPTMTVKVPKYEAMTRPQAEVVAEVTRLYSERARIGSIRAKTDPARAKVHEALTRQKAAIDKRINELVEEVPINMKDQAVRDAVREVTGESTYRAITKQIENVSRQMQDVKFKKNMPNESQSVFMFQMWRNSDEMLDWAEGQLAHTQATKGNTALGISAGRKPTARGGVGAKSDEIPNLNDPVGALRRPQTAEQFIKSRPQEYAYYKLLKQREVLEAQRSKKIADAVLKATNDLNLPEGARLQKYRSIKDWRRVADAYIKIYTNERRATKAADAVAEAAHAAGDTAKATTAAAAKAASGKANGAKVNKALENAQRELQYRVSQGELTVNDLRDYLRANKISAPDLLHDLTNLPGKDSRILHLGDELNTIAKQYNVDRGVIEDILQANERVMRELMEQSYKEAGELSRQVFETALHLMEKSLSLETRRAFGIKLGFFGNGPVVAALKMPQLIERLVDAAYKIDVVKNGIGIFNRTLVSSAGLDKNIARIRAREAGRTTELIKINGARLYEKFSKYPPADVSRAWDDLLNNNPARLHPELVDEMRYELGLIADKFRPEAFPGLREPLTLTEVNGWIPNKKKLVSANGDSRYKLSGGGVPENQDPVEWLLGVMRQTTIRDENPLEVMWNLQIATEKALARKATIETVVQQFGIASGMYGKTDDPVAQILKQKHGYTEHKLGAEGYLFDPETHRQLTKIDELLSSQKMIDTFGEYAGKITLAWKRTVTVRNPGFHVRNTAGDLFVSWLDDVKGVHGIQSHKMALRTVRKFRNLDDAEDPLIRALGNPADLYGTYNKTPKASRPESHNVVLYKKNGQDVTMGDIWALYVNEGLLSGFANTEFGAVFKTKSTPLANAVATKAGQKISHADAQVLAFSEAREDVFRLAHFIDVMRKSKAKDPIAAAAEAGARVRKYHFDYSDFTMTEKLVFARVFPFYKWTRKAMPLMVESLFTKPGKLLVVPKASENFGVAMGFGGNGPDVVTPEWISARFLAPIIDKGNATTYAGIALPYDALAAMGKPGDTMLSMLHPGIKMVLEGAMGEKVTGQPLDWGQTATGLFPQSNVLAKQLSGTGTPEQLAAFLTGLTITQTNSKTTQAELIKRKEKANNALRSQSADR